ncbi:MAG TPA: hypothetical protein VFS21_25435 [Roseiflexaceae bacterium]|nr:hypothetical protein [Roseiflexaceae bacterium]
MTQQPSDQAALAAALVGIWLVDLRPTPDAAPYVQPFQILSVAGNTFTGTFYGAPIRSAFINSSWGEVVIGFLSEDGSGTYFHSARLVDGRLIGASLSPGRQFLMVWRAERAPDAPDRAV